MPILRIVGARLTTGKEMRQLRPSQAPFLGLARFFNLLRHLILASDQSVQTISRRWASNGRRGERTIVCSPCSLANGFIRLK